MVRYREAEMRTYPLLSPKVAETAETIPGRTAKDFVIQKIPRILIEDYGISSRIKVEAEGEEKGLEIWRGGWSKTP